MISWKHYSLKLFYFGWYSQVYNKFWEPGVISRATESLTHFWTWSPDSRPGVCKHRLVHEKGEVFLTLQTLSNIVHFLFYYQFSCLLFIGRGYWQGPSLSIIPYWQGPFLSIIPYWQGLVPVNSFLLTGTILI